MDSLPSNNEEILLINFIAKYQYIDIKDVKYFFKSKKYYKDRITKMINKKLLKKVGTKLVLGLTGIKFAKITNIEYNKLNRNPKNKKRLFRISRISAFYNNCKYITFLPSFSIKDKEIYTMTSRKFIRSNKNKGL